ncbi:MAG: protein kinase [Pyrinomonadaceae bacterium]|nr:protein kinase [Pyrinomonadaceae bacterium]
MNAAKDWEKIEQIVSEALGKSGRERTDFLESCWLETPDLRADVELLLSNESRADEFFDQPAALRFASVIDEGEDRELVGRQIGHYRLVREIGSGGMGAVFLAERTDGEFEQMVAVKMLRREFNTSSIRNRFEQEKQIHAGLEHPNIARLIDAGSTDDGIPFLVMEYIDGEPIVDYCERLKIGLKKRLELFRKVCRAVSFAHRNLVIHRDLKPSNIMIAETGEPKLLDFGISKLLDTEAGGESTVTKFGAMTPEYASPEQIEGSSVTTSTDIYSLGVILFELLTGERPFGDHSKVSRLNDVLESEPRKPSDVVSGIARHSGEAVADISDGKGPEGRPDTDRKMTARTHKNNGETRLHNPVGNPKGIRGDLDNIVLKALRKEPERRYETVEQFSADIRRHLDGLPVSARPATWSYRTGKFVRRNRLAVIAAAIVLVAILGGVFATLWQARIAQAEKLKAEKRFADVRGLAKSILFEIYPSIEKLEGSIDARKQIVDNALKYLDRLSTEASDNKELQLELAEAYKKVADVQGNNKYSNLGDLKGSFETYKKARGLIEDVFTTDPGNSSLKDQLANVLEEEAYVVWWLGDNPEAYKNFKRARKLREELVASEQDKDRHRLLLANLDLFYGDVPFWENKNDEAQKIFESAHESLKTLIAKDPSNLDYRAKYAYSFNRLSKISAKNGKYEEALSRLETAKRLTAQNVEEKPNDYKYREDLWGNQWGICELFILQNKAKEARDRCPETVETRRKMVELEPANLTAKYHLALSYGYLGRAYRMSKEYDKALETLDEAIKNLDLVLKENADNVGYTQERIIALHAKAVVFERQNRFREAESVFVEVAADYNNLLDRNPEDSRSKLNLFKTYADLGKNLELQGRPDDSRSWYKRSVEIGAKLLKAKALGKQDQQILETAKSKI